MRKIIKTITNNTQTKALSGFTLVELIVVVTILSILSTIGFVSYSSYLSGVRDTNRISQLKAIGDSLHLYETKKSLPLPDEKRLEIKDGATTIAIQGYVGKSVIETIGYTSEGKDPKDNTYFSYYLTKDRKYFQLLAFLEDQPETISKLNNLNNLNKLNNLKTTQAIDYENRYPYVEGRKLGILTTETNQPIQETLTGSIDIVGTTNTYKSYLKTKEVITGTGAKFKDLGKVAKSGGRGYSSSGNTIVYGNLDGLPEVPTDWRSVDPNCDIADITIGTQTWAGCNSTIGNGFEWGKKDDGSNGVMSSNQGCYKNHGGSSNILDCVIGSTEMSSTTKSNTWFTGTNSNGDKAPANIWGKLYTWQNAKNTACKNGYHLPSDQEWTILENYLAGTNCRSSTYGVCDGLGWKNHNTKTKDNNLVQALKIPLTGSRNSSYHFLNRGYFTFIWSSTIADNDSSYGRGFSVYSSDSMRLKGNNTYKGYPSRCIKD